MFFFSFFLFPFSYLTHFSFSPFSFLFLSLFLFPSVISPPFLDLWFLRSLFFPFLILFTCSLLFLKFYFCSTSFLGENPKHSIELSPIFFSFCLLFFLFLLFFFFSSFLSLLNLFVVGNTCSLLHFSIFLANHQIPWWNQDY